MSEPIRVLILDTVMDRGGAEAMTMNYYRNIDRSKIQFDFLVHRDYKAAYEDEITSLGGRIYRICPPYPQNYFKYRKAIGKLFSEHPEYKIIHCNMMEHGLPAYVEAKKQNVPVRICHAHIAGEAKFTVKSVVKKVYKKLMINSITHRFACGEEAAKWVFGSSDNVIYMKNAIDANSFRYDKETSQKVKEEFNVENKFVIGHVGRFFSQKNHTFLIDVFNEVAQRDEDAVLMLVGGGELDDALMNQIKGKVREYGLSDRVVFTGVRTDVSRLLQSFDLFVLPSLFEGFPVVAVEAQSAGLKCLISDAVTKECDITGNVEFLPLETGAAIWVEHILKYKDSYVKQDMYKVICDSGYDIKNNAKWLEDFYLQELENCNE